MKFACKDLSVALIAMLIILFGLLIFVDCMTSREAIAQVNTINITKTSVSLVSENGQGQGQYSITLQCELLTDDSPVYTFSITKDYEMGSAPSALYTAFYNAMQAEIDKYEDEQAIYNHSQLDTVVTTLESNLTW